MITLLMRVPLATNGPHLSTSHFFLFIFIFFSPLSSSSARREGGRLPRRSSGPPPPAAPGPPLPAFRHRPRCAAPTACARPPPPAAASSALPCGARRPRPPPASASSVRRRRGLPHLLLLLPPWPARPPARRCPVSCPARAIVGRRPRPASCPWVRDGEDGRSGQIRWPLLLPPSPSPPWLGASRRGRAPPPRVGTRTSGAERGRRLAARNEVEMRTGGAERGRDEDDEMDETDADGPVRVRSVPRNSTGEANPHLAGISSPGAAPLPLPLIQTDQKWVGSNQIRSAPPTKHTASARACIVCSGRTTDLNTPMVSSS